MKNELQALINSIPGAVVKIRYENGLVVEYANDTMYELMQLSKEEFSERYDNHYEGIILEKDWLKLQKSIEQGIREQKNIRMEYRVTTVAGDVQWQVLQASILGERNGNPILQCVISDITEEKLTRLELEKERKKLGAVVNMSADMIFEYDIARDYMTYTHHGEGIMFSEQITENYTQRLSEIIMDEVSRQQLTKALRSGMDNFCIELQRKGHDNEYHWVQVTGKTIFDKENNPEKVLGKVQNIDEQKQKEATLREKSQKDSLTGLYNHMTAKSMIAERVKVVNQGEEAYLIICDIDNFKSLNDINGHMFGDAVLCSFADEMSFLLPNAIRGRIGGDEFILYEDGLSREQLQEQLTRLNGSLSDRYDDEKRGGHISCSIGVVAVNGSVTDFDVLFQLADTALYQVKEKGKGSYLIIDSKPGMEGMRKSYLESEKNKDVDAHKEMLIRNDDELVLFCVELLKHVPNVISALKMICERTCVFYNLDDMVCVEHNGDEVEILYQWSRIEKNDYARRMYQNGVYDWGRLINKTDEQGTIIYREEQAQNIYMEEAKTAMLVFSKNVKDYQGSIVFSDRHKDREWSREKDTLIRISQYIFSCLHTMRCEQREREEMDRKLNYDSLTDLPMYNYFVQKAEEYMRNNPKEGLFCVYSDFSNFQYLNEVYGYEVGDRVLYEFARTLESYEDGIMFCRVTSDHFIGLIRGDEVHKVDQKYWIFTDGFAEKVRKKYDQCNLIIATGLYEVKEEDTRIATMMDNANEARKKCKGQSVVTAVTIYTEEIKKQTESAKVIAANVVSAYNNNEFYAYLQPKVSLKTGKIVGAEALVRWIKPDGTRIMPAQFIDIVERNGFITKIDFCMLEQVMDYLQEAIDAGEEVVPISVNFSRRHNEFELFVPSIFKRLDTYKVPSSMLEAEVTESVFLADLNRLDRNLVSLRERGVKVSVDDFGSGYSSLNLLPRVEVDIIKLDRQFLTGAMNATQEENALIVVKYLIKMLKRLGFTVLAEGVETKEQVEMLKKADCDLAQGYYYAKPMPIDEFRIFLKEFNEKVDAERAGD